MSSLQEFPDLINLNPPDNLFTYMTIPQFNFDISNKISKIPSDGGTFLPIPEMVMIMQATNNARELRTITINQYTVEIRVNAKTDHNDNQIVDIISITPTPSNDELPSIIKEIFKSLI